MTSNVENLIVEHLGHIRSRVDQIATDTDELKTRMSSLESAMLMVKREIVHGDEVDARLQVSLDNLVRRIERIERRMELTE